MGSSSPSPSLPLEGAAFVGVGKPFRHAIQVDRLATAQGGNDGFGFEANETVPAGVFFAIFVCRGSSFSVAAAAWRKSDPLTLPGSNCRRDQGTRASD